MRMLKLKGRSPGPGRRGATPGPGGHWDEFESRRDDRSSGDPALWLERLGRSDELRPGGNVQQPLGQRLELRQVIDLLQPGSRPGSGRTELVLGEEEQQAPLALDSATGLAPTFTAGLASDLTLFEDRLVGDRLVISRTPRSSWSATRRP